MKSDYVHKSELYKIASSFAFENNLGQSRTLSEPHSYATVWDKNYRFTLTHFIEEPSEVQLLGESIALNHYSFSTVVLNQNNKDYVRGIHSTQYPIVSKLSFAKSKDNIFLNQLENGIKPHHTGQHYYATDLIKVNSTELKDFLTTILEFYRGVHEK